MVNHAEVDVLHVNESYDYDKCLREQRSFDGYNSLDEFCDWLFTEKSHSHSTVLAHNGSGYDFRFILKWCLDHGLHPDVFIRQGNRILYMWFRKNQLRFVDTLQFFQQPLADLSATYAIDTIKGHFLITLIHLRIKTTLGMYLRWSPSV